ncbi:hypothetical protein BDV36DRAFT_249904, partial [Aspergillus pseudocaelatus]
MTQGKSFSAWRLGLSFLSVLSILFFFSLSFWKWFSTNIIISYQIMALATIAKRLGCYLWPL